MPWKIQGGRPVKVGISRQLSPPEVTISIEKELAVTGTLDCPYCERTYKTEAGFSKHLAEKH